MRGLGLQSGLLLAVPIPSHHVDQGAEVQTAIETALQEAQAQAIQGNQVGGLSIADVLYILLMLLRLSSVITVMYASKMQRSYGVHAFGCLVGLRGMRHGHIRHVA